MLQIIVDDITYPFSEHAERRMTKEAITIRFVEETLLDPDSIESSKVSPNTLYVKHIAGHEFPLRVAVDEDNRVIASAHWLRRPKWDR